MAVFQPKNKESNLFIDTLKEIPETVSKLRSSVSNFLRPSQTTQQIQQERRQTVLPTEIKKIKTQQANQNMAYSPTLDPMKFYKDQELYIDPNFVGTLENISKKAVQKVAPKVFQGFRDLTTKTLRDLEGKTTVSKQYILDATNRGELKQVERDLIRDILEREKPSVQHEQFIAEKLGGKVKDYDTVFATMKGTEYPKSFQTAIGRGAEIILPNNRIALRSVEDATSIKLPGIAVEKTGTGTGTKAMDALREYADKTGKEISIYKVTNPKYFDKLSWLKKQQDGSYLYKPPDTINVSDFAKKVKAELLPLKISDNKNANFQRYESISLPSELRGNVKNYKENVYESPIQTSASNVHFDENITPNYFGHTRIEDMADNKTRRVIEVQSDLYQKGNLERELVDLPKEYKDWEYDELTNKIKSLTKDNSDPDVLKELKKIKNEFDTQIQLHNRAKPLQQYNDPTAHFRMVREEIKKAAQDGKTKLQFPTGETAMKIEGLGDRTQWYENVARDGDYNIDLTRSKLLTNDSLKVGKEINQSGNQFWIITDVLGDGKFKAVPKDRIGNIETEKELYEALDWSGNWTPFKEDKTLTNALTDIFENQLEPDDLFAKYDFDDLLERYKKASVKTVKEADKETFDISGKVDTNNPIYKFYEKDMQKYLNKFGGKRVVDDRGVEWIEVPINKEQGKAPVDAFGRIKVGALLGAAGAGSLFVKGMQPSTITYKKEDGVITQKSPLLPSQLNQRKLDSIRQGILHVENEGATSTGQDVYQVIGYTGDIGKYQVNPKSLSDWSEAWLGKKYTPQEFKNDPDAQEQFFNEFLRVVDRLKLTEEQAAIAWHRGWGELGTGSRETRDKRFKDKLNSLMTDEISQAYLDRFKEGLQNQ